MNTDLADLNLMDFYSSSDYGSASSIESELEVQAMIQKLQLQDAAAVKKNKQISTSFNDLRSPSRVDDVMNEFRKIGSDTPYEPEDDEFWEFKLTAAAPVAAPSNQYHRQKSWPGAEKSQYNKASASELGHTRQKRQTPADLAYPSPLEWKHPHDEGLLPRLRASNQISQEQLAVLQSLPDEVLHALLNDFLEYRGYTDKMAKKKATEFQSGGGGGGGECRFCANNGERTAWVRSHTLKDVRGRVACPVLRAFVCARCGASGDNAHTIKYCPFSTEYERQLSTAMMRSVRLASGRKRIMYPAPPSVNHAYDDATSYKPTAINRPMNNPLDLYQPLEPVWAALEKKLAW